MSLSEDWIMVLVVMTFVSVGAIVFRMVRARRQVDEPPAVREGSHEVANEATKVRAGLHKISQSQDPLQELLSRMTGHQYERHR